MSREYECVECGDRGPLEESCVVGGWRICPRCMAWREHALALKGERRGVPDVLRRWDGEPTGGKAHAD